MRARERVGDMTVCRCIKSCLALVVATGFFACSNDMQVINQIIDREEEEPDLTAYRIEVLYSDSAHLQMKMQAPVVKQFTSSEKPRDEFPEGMHVWMYGQDGTLEAEITANWATRDLTKKLWEARSNVVLSNGKGKRLESEQMFWDQEKAIIYSEKFTKYISETGDIATGRSGMRAKQDFSDWELLMGNGSLMMNDATESGTTP
ncbi:MAG: LPS export ABC transporter periplasmic protein LptC [Bacteroidales bacterium]|jgi:LPS export ABC transporter protein LptC|nr:LPS export ABC transporter periplasmic protein LptC [Bacteroidales bacterium]